MSLIERSAVQAPVLPKETVPMPSLGGDVIVRGLLLSERLTLSALSGQLSEPHPGESVELAQARAGAQMVSHTLARAVVLADGQPFYSVAQWDQFGAKHTGDVLALFQASRRLNGYDEGDTEKN